MNHHSNTENDILDAWKQMSEEKFSQSTIKKEEIMSAITKESNTTINRLIRTILMKIYWCTFFIVGLTALLLFNLKNGVTTYAIIAGIIIYFIGLIPMLLKYRDLKNENTSVYQSILEELKSQHQKITSTLKVESFWGLFFLPVAIILGFLAGLDSQGDLMDKITQPWILAILLGMVCVGAPTLYYITGKMNERAYGKDLKKLEENIIKMEVLS